MYPDKDVTKATTTAFGRNLWYLSKLLVDFNFLDEKVLAEKKRMIIVALKDSSEEPLKCIPPFREPETKGLHDFIAKSTLWFFKIFDLPEEFWEHDPMNGDTRKHTGGVRRLPGR